MFFSDETNSKALGTFLRKAEASHIGEEARKKRLDISREIVGYIYRSPAGWDERCTFNIEHIGNQYIQSLREFDPSKLTSIDHIYSMSYRFLCEFDFLVGAGKELSMELRHIKNKIQHDNDEIDDDVRSQIIYASYVMPANIAKQFINDANIGVFREFEQKKAEAEELREKWDSEIAGKEQEVNQLKEKLEEYKNAFNFVGLYQGFSELRLQKQKEAFWLFLSLISMGFVILSPLVFELIVVSFQIYNPKSLTSEPLLILIPIASIEIILIYYFRVILVNFRSVKAQLMQIELRQTLCQFIQSYSEYSAKIKKDDKSALEKFENLIFSGVISDPGKIPSTYDGLDQIGSFIKSIKNS